MDDELKKLEEVLARMPLRRPPASLDAKVLRPGQLRIGRWVAIGGVVAAAAVVVAVFILWPGSAADAPVVEDSPSQVEQALDPVQVEETVWHVAYEGLFVPVENTPVRMFRHRSIRRTRLLDGQSGYTVEVTVPDEQVLLVSAEVY